MSDKSQEEKKEASGVFIDVNALFGDANVDEATLLEMAKAGVLYGHKKNRRNPKFNEYIFTTRNGVEVIDLAKTVKSIDFVSTVLKKAIETKRNILIVGTQPASRDAVMALSEALGECPFVVNKWIGGLVTNFGNISKRIEYFKKQRLGLAENKFEGYTKKEKLMIAKEVTKMQEKFFGFENLSAVPDMVFVIDGSIKGHETAIHEAKIKKAKVIGIIDSDDNPDDFDYFVPANDHARSSINWVINRIISNLK